MKRRWKIRNTEEEVAGEEKGRRKRHTTHATGKRRGRINRQKTRRRKRWKMGERKRCNKIREKDGEEEEEEKEEAKKKKK